MQSALERATKESDSLVAERNKGEGIPRVGRLGYGARRPQSLTANPKHSMSPIVNEYREGKLKRTHDRE